MKTMDANMSVSGHHKNPTLATKTKTSRGWGTRMSAHPGQNFAHEIASFELAIRASFAETAALFGPEGERVWAGKEWDPQWIYPLPGRDEQGGVFTIERGGRKAVWVIARHDLEARYFQYVYFFPELMVTTIEVRFSVEMVDQTRVGVTYTRTALSEEGNRLVGEMAAEDRLAGGKWQAAIDQYLKPKLAA